MRETTGIKYYADLKNINVLSAPSSKTTVLEQDASTDSSYKKNCKDSEATASPTFVKSLKTKFFPTRTAEEIAVRKRTLSFVCYKISKFFVACIIFYVLGIFVPELREKLSALYEFIDMSLDFLNWCYELLLEILKWSIRILTFEKITL